MLLSPVETSLVERFYSNRYTPASFFFFQKNGKYLAGNRKEEAHET